ncbi:MAG: MFS transporter [Rhodobiaceae bacterium]|nr:MAG: MFS transporter [Rhodobiaceae bacterium]
MYAFALAVPAILRKSDVPLSFLGFLGFLLLPWVFKFMWAPLIDRFWSKRLGRRRSWLLPSQMLVIGGMVVLSQLNLAVDYWWVFGIGLVVAFASATQDAAADGFSVDHLDVKDRPIGSAIQGASVGAGVLIGGMGTLLLYDLIGWERAMLVMVVLTTFAALPVWLLREKAVDPKTQRQLASLKRFFRKPGIWSVLMLAFVFRCSEGLFKAMEIPFLVDLGFSMTTIGVLSGASGATIGVAGSFLAALAIRRFGVRSCLIGLCIARLACYLAFVGVALADGLPPEFAIAAAMADTVIRYVEIVVLYSYFMKWSAGSQSATDFSVLSSAQLFLYMVSSMVSGLIADALGYVTLFSLASGLSVLTLIAVMVLLGTRSQAQVSGDALDPSKSNL